MAEALFNENLLKKFYPFFFRQVSLEEFTGRSSPANIVDDQIMSDSEISQGSPSVEDIKRFLDEEKSASPSEREAAEDILRSVKILSAKQGISQSEIEVDLSKVIDPQEFDSIDGDLPISVILSNDVAVSPQRRNIGRIHLFFNSIPTVEMSRCTPFLEVKAQSILPGVNTAGELQRMSLQKFLENPLRLGSESGADGIMTNAIARGKLSQIAKERKHSVSTFEKGSFATGMEMFTSPQTLVNANANDPNGDNVSVFDPFRPFMSIEEFRVDMKGQYNAEKFSAKTAQLNLVLHDRSRLSEIREMMVMGQLALVVFRITYGWQHPDGPEVGNPYADLLNSMKVTRLFQPVGIDFSLEQAGQVRIIVKLIEMGTMDIYGIKISDGVIEPSQKLNDRIRHVLDVISKSIGSDKGKKKAANLQSKMTLPSSLEQYVTQPEVKKKLRPFIDKFLKHGLSVEQVQQAASDEDITQFIAAIEEYLGDSGSGDDGEVSERLIPGLLQQRDAVIRKKFRNLLFGTDPFYPDATIADRIELTHPAALESDRPLEERLADIVGPDAKTPRKYVTLGKFITSFIGPPLVKNSDAIDEVAFVFHTCNNASGAAAGLSIASFMLDYENVIKRFQSRMSARGDANVSLAQMLGFLSEVVSDETNAFYGINTRRSADDREEKGTQSKGATKKERDEGRTKANTAIEDKIDEQGGTFTPVQLEFTIDARPVVSRREGSSVDERRNLARIHVFDRLATPYVGARSLLLASVDAELSKVRRAPIGDGSSDNDIIAEAERNELIEVGEDGTISLRVDAPTLKEFIKKRLPSVTYGTNNSMIIEAGLKTQQESDIHAIRVIDALKKGGPSGAPGSEFAGLPIEVNPSQFDVTVMGCPLMEFMSQMFWDIGTNTTTDTIYAAVDVSHEIRPGSFTTKSRLRHTNAYAGFSTAMSKVRGALDRLQKIKQGDE